MGFNEKKLRRLRRLRLFGRAKVYLTVHWPQLVDKQHLNEELLRNFRIRYLYCVFILVTYLDCQNFSERTIQFGLSEFLYNVDLPGIVLESIRNCETLSVIPDSILLLRYLTSNGELHVTAMPLRYMKCSRSVVTYNFNKPANDFSRSIFRFAAFVKLGKHHFPN
ncbi:hypothetical protein G5I_06409 [Acromyrmex echinatior]|uniref:Uncharacterized protein n=1 Tax=Acromyrmex echinatior TaxID=103372 RepID=F4WKY8_ACREC|nr:hypothetical protein G5I_06409 [Acromyrmex echinatior]